MVPLAMVPLAVVPLVMVSLAVVVPLVTASLIISGAEMVIGLSVLVVIVMVQLKEGATSDGCH